VDKEMKRVYVAGKLTALAVDYLQNCYKMMNTAQLLKEAGYSVYVPCLDLLMGIAYGYESIDEYFDNGIPWLKASDAVFLTPGWETSKGTRKEIEIALENSIPVFDHLDEMWSHFQGVPGGAITSLKTDSENNVIGVIKVRNSVPDYAVDLDKKPAKEKKYYRKSNTETLKHLYEIN
jgi:hypothetical protein